MGVVFAGRSSFTTVRAQELWARSPSSNLSEAIPPLSSIHDSILN
jgi:hypothetical protein